MAEINPWEEMLQAALTGGVQGFGVAQSRRNKMYDEIEKAITIEQMKNNIKRDSYGNIKPAPGMKLKSQKQNQYGVMENVYEPIVKTSKPEYKVVGGNIIQLPTVAGEKPTVAYEDPNKIKASKNASKAIISSTQDMLNTVKTVRKGKNYFGPAGGVPTLITSGLSLSKDYGPRKVWESEIQKLLAQRMMDKMMELKAASKTGSTGFGQLTEREGRKIQEASTALNRELLPDDADRYLAIMEDSLNKILQAAQKEIGGYSIENGESDAMSNSIQEPNTTSQSLTFTSAKIKKARELRTRYPNMSKREIIDMVNKEF